MLFVFVSFVMHPIQYVRDWRFSRKHFDKEGNLRDPAATPDPRRKHDRRYRH